MNKIRASWSRFKACLTASVGSRLLPSGYIYADELTFTGQQAARRFLVGAVGVAIGIVAVVMLKPEFFREVLAGALIGFSVSVMLGAHNAFKRNVDNARRDVERIANRETLHARFNRLDHAAGLRIVDLDIELPQVEEIRMERLAHYAHLNEFRPDLRHHNDHMGAYEFWDDVALGRRE